jgi:hypothetical protein
MGKLITTLALTNDLIKSLVLRIYQSLPWKFLPMVKESYFEKAINITIEDQIIDIGIILLLF